MTHDPTTTLATDPKGPTMNEATAVETAPALDETARRKPDFAGGVPVRMADGSTWQIPKPRIRFACDDTPAGVRVVTDFGADFDEKVRAVEAATDPAARVGMLFKVASAMLCRNYDLSLEDRGPLLTFELGTPDAMRHLWDCYAVATGGGPSAPATPAPGA